MKRSLILILFVLPTYVSAFSDGDLERLITTGNCPGCDLSAANLVGKNLIGADLSYSDLGNANLTGVNLTEANLTGANLVRASLVNSKLTKAILAEAYLYDAKLVGADFSETNLIGARLSGADMTGANFREADLGGAGFFHTRNRHLGENMIEIKEIGNYLGVTSFDLSGDVIYFTAKVGDLYALKNIESKEGKTNSGRRSQIVLDLNNDSKFFSGYEGGLLSVVSNNDRIYISYTVKGDDTYSFYLVVDEYSKSFNKIRTIKKIGSRGPTFVAGTLVFDRLGKLYLSVGDGGIQDDAQNLESLRGKILRFDVSKTNPEPEIVAYGLRNPWKISIDSNNRLFVGDCGEHRVESVYLLDDLYPSMPYNLGWPVFEGTERRTENSLKFQDTLAPIYEYRHYSRNSGIGRCVIGGLFLDELEVYLFGDVTGMLRLLKRQKDGKWHEIHFQDMGVDNMWSFGYDERSKKLFMSGSSKISELTILSEKIDLLPQVILCGTTMPNGAINNLGC